MPESPLSQNEAKTAIRLWLKNNRKSYKWLAEKIYFAPRTVEKWMCPKTTIPPARLHAIFEVIKEYDCRINQESFEPIAIMLPAEEAALARKIAEQQKLSLRRWLEKEIMETVRKTEHTLKRKRSEAV